MISCQHCLVPRPRCSISTESCAEPGFLFRVYVLFLSTPMLCPFCLYHPFLSSFPSPHFSEAIPPHMESCLLQREALMAKQLLHVFKELFLPPSTARIMQSFQRSAPFLIFCPETSYRSTSGREFEGLPRSLDAMKSGPHTAGSIISQPPP